MPSYEVRDKQHQLKVYADGRYVAALQNGRYRPYVYPVFTPAGHAVTQATSADHIHHLSIWLGHHDVNGANFWAPETYEIAPSPKLMVRATETTITEAHVRFTQRIEWWNSQRNPVLFETRITTIAARPDGNIVDVDCTLAAGSVEVAMGQTKEAGLGVRVADQIDVLDGGRITNADGGVNEAETFDKVSAWVDYSGPVTRDALAGIAIFPRDNAARVPWFTRDYGPVMINPWRQEAMRLAPGETFSLAARFVAHDGDREKAKVADLYARFREEAKG